MMNIIIALDLYSKMQKPNKILFKKIANAKTSQDRKPTIDFSGLSKWVYLT